MKNKLYILILGLLPFYTIAQQKPLFTNYVFNEYYYNPAVASTKESIDFRFIYRNQWAGLEGKPHTQTFSTCTALKSVPLGLGGNLYHDNTGPLRHIGMNVSASYGIRLKNKSMISAGLSAGMIHYRLDTDIRIREQGDAAVIAAQDAKVAADIGLGIYYKWKGLYAGFSIPQIVETSLNFEVDDPNDMDKLIRHYFIAAGYRFSLSDKFDIEPSVLLKAVKAAPFQGDINLRGIYNELVWLGVAYRTQDAASIMAGLIFNDMFEIGYAYDITTSNLNSVSNGSHEIMIGYRINRSNIKQGASPNLLK